MSYKVDVEFKAWRYHPLRLEWSAIPMSDPTYGSPESYQLFLKQEYNIHLLGDYIDAYGSKVLDVELTFESEQDYILWKLLE